MRKHREAHVEREIFVQITTTTRIYYLTFSVSQNSERGLTENNK